MKDRVKKFKFKNLSLSSKRMMLYEEMKRSDTGVSVTWVRNLDPSLISKMEIIID